MRKRQFTLKQYLERHQQTDIAKAVGIHHSRLYRAKTGVSPCEFVFEERNGEVVMMEVIGRGPIPPKLSRNRSK